MKQSCFEFHISATGPQTISLVLLRVMLDLIVVVWNICGPPRVLSLGSQHSQHITEK